MAQMNNISNFPPLLTPDEGPLLETSIFPLSFQVVREPLPFAYQMNKSMCNRRTFYAAKLKRVDIRHYNWDKPAKHKTFENLTHNGGQGNGSEVIFVGQPY